MRVKLYEVMRDLVGESVYGMEWSDWPAGRRVIWGAGGGGTGLREVGGRWRGAGCGEELCVVSVAGTESRGPTGKHEVSLQQREIKVTQRKLQEYKSEQQL
ncbi:unnamed protein product [Pleuronectes platessa]|uniref:Uncharacterized protein n=1 Tax=Pleuronectes platessa TaxID=8262 RepID=A0A9N7YAX2_PLEPL|nr:unnamed protein product [Pleuronectes platessa]